MNFVISLFTLHFVFLSTVSSDNGNSTCLDFEKFEYAFKVVETLSNHDGKIEMLEAKLQEFRVTVSAQEVRLSKLTNDLQGANSEIEELTEKLAELENQVDCQTGPSGKDSFVGFTAYLSRDARNLPVGRPIVLQSTLLNEGGGYSTVTGKFTAPVSGFYSFTVVIESKNYGSCVIRLVVDGANTLDVVVEPYHTEQNLHGVNAGVLSLQAGQKVWIEPYQVNTPFLEGTDYYRFTTFSGALLQRH